MTYLAGLALSVACFGIGIYRRRRTSLPIDGTYTTKLAWVSLGLGMALGSLVFPSLWLFVSFSLYGGRVEDNLPPGTDARFLLDILLVGAAMTATYTFFGYRDHVFARNLADDRPIPLQPEDRAE